MFSRRLGLGLGLRPRGAVLPRRGALRALAAPADGHVFNAGDTDGPQPMSVFGAQRVALAKEVMLVLKSMPCKPRFFLDNGTLLGLWRNDDDRGSIHTCVASDWRDPETYVQYTYDIFSRRGGLPALDAGLEGVEDP